VTIRETAVAQARAPVVLVVEDEPCLRLVAADYLEECGFAVLQAANADEAIALLRRRDGVAAVFSDIQMPGSVNGVGLARWIAEALPDVAVLLTTGQTLHGNPREWPLLAKPYDLAEVECRLREMVERGDD
jgi:CheY-like chemotaxis protein